MVRKNGLLGLLVLFVLLMAALSLGIVAAQQAQPTTQPAQPTAQAAPATTSSSAEYPYLGVRLEDTTAGIVVRQVMDSSPAATAGLKVDDMIEKLNDTAVTNSAAFADALAALKIGDKITLAVKRDGKDMTLTATIGSTATNQHLDTNDAFNAIAFNSTDKSWPVFSLADRSDLASAGLKTGDIIKQFNGTAYAPADLSKFFSGLTDKDMVKLTVERAGKSMDVTAAAPALKSLNLFTYAQQGMLFNLIPQTKNSQPDVNVGDLDHTVPFDVLGYTMTGNAWQVYGLADGSALATAGLKSDDQITQFNGAPVDPAGLETFRAKLADSDMVKLTVQRAGKSMDITVPAAALNTLHLFDYESGGMLFGLPANPFGASAGINSLALTADIAKEHNVKSTSGALVLEVFNDSAAASAGLQANDVITAVDKQTVDATHTLDSLLATHKPGDKVTLSITRADKPMDIPVTLAQPDISGQIPFLAAPI